jgi:hypothetical protein
MRNFAGFFDPAARIVFDIPFKNTAVISDDVKRISKDDRQQQPVINMFGKFVNLEMYFEIMEREAEKFGLNDLDFSVRLTGKEDMSRVDRDTIIYEVEKHFSDSDWCMESNVKYLVCIGYFKNEPRILTIYPNDENTTQTFVQIRLTDASVKSKDDPGYFLSDFDVRLRVTFKEPINNITMTGTTGSDGVVRFGRVANNNSVIFLDTVVNRKGTCYSMPVDWNEEGKSVGEQPAGGYVISLKPYKLSLFDYSLFLSAGGFVPGEADMVNFQSPGGFESKMGYKYGLGINFTYFFLANQCHYNPMKGIFGLGSGISADYQGSVVTSNTFEQQKYDFFDQGGDACQVWYSGKDFTERNDMISVAIPVFLEFRKQAGNRFWFSAKAGVSFSVPVASGYEASGTFSRWGYYDDLNSLPITDDRVYNYFTDSTINYSGDIEYGTILGEGFIKLNGLFSVGNASFINLGLAFSLPFTSGTEITYPEGQPQDYLGYWINTGNDEYHSVAYATEKIYRYYFGLSVGFNMMRGRIR